MKPGEKDLPPLPSETESVCELVKMREEHLAYLRVAASGTGVEVRAEDYLVIAAVRRIARQHRRVPGDGGRAEHILR